jgi:wyosine [tRNA(Phe)-imidazoG37] synthetase (radical SAM superfamily)
VSENVKLEVFTKHSRSWGEFRYVYPVISRRSRGLSIGVNLNPDGACNFDCVYCCVDRTHPREVPPVDVEILRAELREMLDAAADGSIYTSPPFENVPLELRRLNDIAFSGDGEPTASPVFLNSVQLAAEELHARGLREVKLVLITNSTLLDRARVIKTLEIFDQNNGEIWAKLDAGTDEYYHVIERTNIPLKRVLDNILATGWKRAIVIQSMFLRYDGHPPSDAEVDAYAGRLQTLSSQGCQIKSVHLYTVARSVADVRATALSDAELNHIASRLTHLNLPVEKFYSPTSS